MNPWSLHTALFAKHAQHVVIIHFPMALFLVGVALDFVATWSGRKDLASSAYISLTIAAFSAIPAVATGLLAWQWELEGRRIRGILLYHLIAGCVSLLLMFAVWRIHGGGRREQAVRFPAYRWPLELLAVLIVALTGHLGGFLSGVNHP